jgi:ParB/RepB/Spo0J family partition protein
MATKKDFKAAHQRILSRPPSRSKSDQELLRKTEDDGVYPPSLNMQAVRLDRIVPDPSHPVRTFSEQSLAELSQSLAARGQLVPIVLQYVSEDDNFVLVDGERRWRAAQLVGMKTLQAVILGRMEPAERAELRLALALHQAGWDSGECVRSLEAYKADQGLDSWADVAARLGLSESTVTALLRAPAATADESAEPEDVVEQVVATGNLLDHVLSRLRPGQNGDADVVHQALEALDEVEDLLCAHRARLERSSRAQPDASAFESATGKPVRSMPTWG